MATPTLEELATQVAQLYASCNAMSLTVQSILSELSVYNVSTPEIQTQITSLQSQLDSTNGNVSVLNNTLTKVVTQVNLLSISPYTSG